MTEPHSRSPKPKWSLFKKLVVWGVVLAVLAFVFRVPIVRLIFSVTGLSMTKAVDNRPLGYFYRFTANFSHKGEPLNFDYVVACNIRITSYRGNGTSNDTTFSPKVMMMPTSDGAAIMVRTINACRGGTTESGKVSKDLFPMAIWFDDVEDMTFGWGYATEDAYENKLSQLEFHGAAIHASNREEWEAWREASAKDFKKTGMIVMPWGMTFNEPWYVRSATKSYDHSRRRVAHGCRGYSRLELPENIRAEVKALWPEKRSRYWVPARKLQSTIGNILRKGKYPNDMNFKGFSFDLFRHGTHGLPLRHGNGTIMRHLGEKIPPDVYPSLPRSQSTIPLIEKPADSYPRRVLYGDGRMKGFMACGGEEPVDEGILRFDPRALSKDHPFFVDDYLASERHSPLDFPTFFFDRDMAVFIQT